MRNLEPQRRQLSAAPTSYFSRREATTCTSVQFTVQQHTYTKHMRRGEEEEMMSGRVISHAVCIAGEIAVQVSFHQAEAGRPH